MSAQHTTNRSTGPKTPEGKAISSQNAVKHGLRSSFVYVPVGLETEFDTFSDYYNQAFLTPNSSPAQRIMYDQLLRAGWIIERIQLALIAVERNMPNNDPLSQWNHEKLQKHLARTEASYRFFLKQLQSIQTNELLAQAIPELAEQTVPSLVDSKYVAREIKRTLKIRAEKSDLADLNGV